MYAKDGTEISAAVNQINALKAAGYTSSKPVAKKAPAQKKAAATKPVAKKAPTSEDLDI